MKVCIVGAGAIGGFIGTRLAATGACAVSALARGATLAALQSHGWRLRREGALVQAPVTASDRAEALGRQDLVVIAVKGPALAAVADSLAPLLGPDTAVLPAMNGVPWWFAHGILPPEQASLSAIDPDGRIARGIPAARVVGCVVHASTSTPEPGVVRHHMGGASSSANRTAPRPPGSSASPRCSPRRASAPRPRAPSARTSGTSCGAT